MNATSNVQKDVVPRRHDRVGIVERLIRGPTGWGERGKVNPGCSKGIPGREHDNVDDQGQKEHEPVDVLIKFEDEQL